MANANPMDSSKWWDLMSSHWEELLQPGQMQKLQMDPGRLRSDGRFSRFGTQMHQRFVVNASLWGEPRWFGSWKDQNRVPSIASAVRFWGISVDRMPRWFPKYVKGPSRRNSGRCDLQDWSRGFCLAAGWGVPGSSFLDHLYRCLPLNHPIVMSPIWVVFRVHKNSDEHLNNMLTLFHLWLFCTLECYLSPPIFLGGKLPYSQRCCFCWWGLRAGSGLCCWKWDLKETNGQPGLTWHV